MSASPRELLVGLDWQVFHLQLSGYAKLLSGNFLPLFDLNSWDFHNEITQKYGGIVRIEGPLKDQPIYEPSNVALQLHELGSHHRKQHKMLNPVFNTLHLCQLTSVFYGVTHKLRKGLTSKVITSFEEVDILHWLNCCAIQLTGQGGLGYSFDNLTDDSVHLYSQALWDLELLIKHLNPMFTFVLPWTKKIGTPQFQRLVVDLTPWKMLHVFRDIVDVMDATVTEIYDEKKHVLDRGEEVADKDIMGIALVRTLHLLVQHPGTQEDLWQELIDATQNHEGDLLYDTLMALPHLDAVCHQMLQLFPPVPIVLCIYITREDVVLPLLHPIRAMDSTNMNTIHIPRVTDIMLSIYVANRNSGTWGADAVSWNPARWCALLPKAHVLGIYSHIHDVYSGFKFTQLEMKVVLSVLVMAFRFLLSDKEVVWDMGFILSPRVWGEHAMQMPLKLTLRDAA
ncbi:cytochrome P450 [Mycena sp. CBHHK59/15]|nr:cytochrome P450 [Mycena sp. CBHHK59/15]